MGNVGGGGCGGGAEGKRWVRLGFLSIPAQEHWVQGLAGGDEGEWGEWGWDVGMGIWPSVSFSPPEHRQVSVVFNVLRRTLAHC